MLTGVLAQLKALTRIALYFLAAFFVIRLWQDPSGSADATVHFVGSVGSFFASAVNKLSQFIRSLSN